MSWLRAEASNVQCAEAPQGASCAQHPHPEQWLRKEPVNRQSSGYLVGVLGLLRAETDTGGRESRGAGVMQEKR